MGEEIVLTAVDGNDVQTGYQSQVSFNAAASAVSFGRVTTNSAKPEFWPLQARTFGAVNSAPKIGPVIINEIMYRPGDIPPGTDNSRDEYVELHNITTSSVNLSGWKLKGDSDFVFPNDSTILPGDYVLLTGFNPATDTSSLNAFRSAYGVPPGVPVFGPFTPKLANDSQSLELAYPAAATGGFVPLVLVDKAEYLDAAPWPPNADGTGKSVQRQSRVIIGNDPANWIGATPTPGNVNVGESPILDSDGDGIPDTWETAHGFNPKDTSDAGRDTDGDGQTNLTEFLAGTDPRNARDSLTVSVMSNGGAGMSIAFPAKANISYTVQFKNSLDETVWQKLADFPATGSDRLQQATDATEGAQRFYRVITPMQP